MIDILGIDLGTNSIGIAGRNKHNNEKLEKQIEYFAVHLFDCPLENKNNSKKTASYVSSASIKTTFRSARKLYKVRRYRKIATLKLLIRHGCCPLTIEDLEKWTKYDKDAAIKHQYPIDNKAFMSWIRLDFNNDGIPEYKTPYELRNELATIQLDFNDQTSRYKLGRAMYHIAQRRGFKSSKGTKADETTDVTDFTEDTDMAEELKKSESARCEKLAEYMNEHQLPTAGCAFHQLSENGTRVRDSQFQAIRSQYKSEITYIFRFQNGLDTKSELYTGLVSERKSDGTIFYKRKLGTQKGNVGKCLLEPGKPRCPESRPEYETFRTWSFINNIRFGDGCCRELTLQQKQRLVDDCFVKAKGELVFSDIRRWIEKETGEKYTYSRNKNESTINYKDNTSVPGCKVTYRLRELLKGKDTQWQDWRLCTEKTHTGKGNSSLHKVTYTWEDVWHICFTAENEEELASFAETAALDQKKLKQLWNAMNQGYASLSLKAINNINRFLTKGMTYDQACIMAKLPDIFNVRDSKGNITDRKWTDELEHDITAAISHIMQECKKKRTVTRIANSLIAAYKQLPQEELFAYKDYEYLLQEDDIKTVEQFAAEAIGTKTWQNMHEEQKKEYIENVAMLYQQFFNDRKRDYIATPTLESAVKTFLADNFCELDTRRLDRLYHHSLTEYYPPAPVKRTMTERGMVSVRLVQNPAISSLKNPMAMRVLHTLRHCINDLLTDGMIGEDTRIVVEVPRELNDRNTRAAIERNNETNEAENRKITEAIEKHYPGVTITEDMIAKARLFMEQTELHPLFDSKKDRFEQKAICIYTGKEIAFGDLFKDNAFDCEHTIPRSLSFDDSLKNMTVCDAHFNRRIKKNMIPCQLDCYDDIAKRIKPWKDKVEKLEYRLKELGRKAKAAPTADMKSENSINRTICRMQYEYWKGKVERFEMKELKPGFRNAQLVDTGIISKYAFHLLKSVFSRVEVQRGTTTATFRKIAQLQDAFEEKNRDNHSHHAIDAMMLTLIPPAQQRDTIMQLYFEMLECRQKDKAHANALREQLENECRKCGITPAETNAAAERIKQEALVAFHRKHQAFAPASRRVRVRGKIDAVRDILGNVIFETDSEGRYRLDKYGNRIPLARRWSKGDCVRGQLHNASNLGAVCMKREGDEKDQIYYVMRRPLAIKKSKQDNGFTDWQDLRNKLVNQKLADMMMSQFPEGTTLDEAIKQGIYMTGSNGRKTNRIRKVRCVTKDKDPMEIKKHTCPSSHEYKRYVYAQSADIFAICLYSDGKKKDSVVHHLINMAKDRKNERESIPQQITKGKGTVMELRNIIQKGNMLLIYKDKPEELYGMDNRQLSQRLYVVKSIEKDKRVSMQRHNIAKDITGKPITSFDNLPERIRCSLNSINFLQEGKDFEIKNGRIIFTNK